MSTLDRIIELINQKGLSQEDLTTYLGLGKQAFTDWKAGRTSSYKKYIDKIAEYLGVSADYLLCKTDIKKSPTVSDERLDKINLIKNKMAFLDEEQLEHLDYFVTAFLKNQ